MFDCMMHMSSSLPGAEPQANQGDCKKGGAKLRIFLRLKDFYPDKVLCVTECFSEKIPLISLKCDSFWLREFKTNIPLLHNIIFQMKGCEMCFKKSPRLLWVLWFKPFWIFPSPGVENHIHPVVFPVFIPLLSSSNSMTNSMTFSMTFSIFPRF